jgi:hypothetical protein
VTTGGQSGLAILFAYMAEAGLGHLFNRMFQATGDEPLSQAAISPIEPEWDRMLLLSVPSLATRPLRAAS